MDGSPRVSGKPIPSLAIFTIVSRNYIAYAATLMQTIAEHHPEAARFVFLADEDYEFTGVVLPAEIVKADSIGIPEFSRMAFRYSIVELNTAIKPSCFQWLFRNGYRQAIYLDPDIFLVRPLEAVVRLLDQAAPIVLTPHITQPLQDGYYPDDLTIMKSGIYNLGFVAFSNGAPATAFLSWWAARLERYCRVDIANNMFVDQRWMDMAPAFVPNTAILHHPGYNVAYWNLAHRPVTFDPTTGWYASGEPLCFVHFSGIDPGRPHAVSKHQNRLTTDTLGDIRFLFELYVEKLLANGYAAFIDAPYAYAQFEDGRNINFHMRNYARRLEDSSDSSVSTWRKPASCIFDGAEPALSASELPDITRLMYQLWLDRRDLQAVFQLDTTAGRTEYTKWFVQSAQAQAGIDDESLLAAATLTRDNVRSALPLRLRHRLPAPELPWENSEPWHGSAYRADAYIAARVKLKQLETSIPRHFAILWEARADLQNAFPLRTLEHVENYLRWCLTNGFIESRIAPELLGSDFWNEMNRQVDSSIDDPPITFGLSLVYTLAGEWASIAQGSDHHRGRLKLALWFLLEAPRRYRWPREMTQRLRDYAAAPITPSAADVIPIPRLLFMLGEGREDLAATFDIRNTEGQLSLLCWFLFHGMYEYRLTVEDLPPYLRKRLQLPADERRELPLLHRLILRHRVDLVPAFDVETIEGRRDYLGWFRQHGALELKNTILSELAFSEQRSQKSCAPIKPPRHRISIVLTGCLSAPSGRGEDIRMTMAALDSFGVPYAILDREDGQVRDNAGDRLDPGTLAHTKINILHLNADTAFDDYLFLREYKFESPRIIGYWAWELAKFPQRYFRSFSFVDEIWASTRFAFDAFDIGYRPVNYMPMPVEIPRPLTPLDRAYFRLSERDFLFLFNFDFGSYRARKNPEAAIAAFKFAFPDNSNVGLVIKTINADRYPEEWHQLKSAAQGDHRIILRDGRFTREEMLNLIRICDCYVSLHRSEGFGRGPAEAMLLGRPVVATNYSGNTDFMNEANSFPVDYDLIPVKDGDYPGADDQVWAEPGIQHAAAQIRRVFDDPAAAIRLGKCASRLIRKEYSAKNIGRSYLRRLLQIDPELNNSRLHRRLETVELAMSKTNLTSEKMTEFAPS